jgi:4-amino-4-deoxy-L-arabinose transferase-like glycosyltransferase
MKRTVYIALILIIILGAILRFYQLGEAPAGLYIDEAGQGYSAYSILQTGKDEFGKPWPIVFRSFTDFKTPVYTYLIAPIIPFLGLNSFTIRFPSAIFGVMTLPVLFLLIKKLSKNQTLALLATLLLAISPWHILFSRTDYECNVALFFYLVGIYLFYLGLRTPWLVCISLVVLAISAIAYQSERFIVPLTAMILLFRHRTQLISQNYRSKVVVGVVLGFIVVLPTLTIAFTPGFLARASGLNIFSTNKQLPAGTILDYQGVFSEVVNSAWFLSSKEFSALYLSYFSPRFMFDLGDYGPRSSYPDMATFFVWQFPFYLIGLVILFKNKFLYPELKFLVLLLLILTPIPAAITRDPYSSIRSLPLVVPQLIIISLGISEFFKLFNKKSKIIIASLIGGIVVYSVLHLYSSVIILNEYYRAVEWDYGLEEVCSYIKDFYQEMPVIFDNSRDEMYIQVAFFLKYDPKLFQEQNFEVELKDYYNQMDRVKEKKIGKIITRPINWDQDLKTEQYLVGDELAISHEQIKEHQLFLKKEVYYPDGSVAFRIVKTNPQFELRQKEPDK